MPLILDLEKAYAGARQGRSGLPGRDPAFKADDL
jgi:hypothetical protein